MGAYLKKGLLLAVVIITVVPVFLVWRAMAGETLMPIILPGAVSPCYQSNDSQAKRVYVRCHDGTYILKRDEAFKSWVIERPDHTISHVPDWQR